MSLTDNGWVFHQDKMDIEFPTRALTRTEYNYRKGLTHGFGKGSYTYPHELYELVEDNIDSLLEKLAKGTFVGDLNRLLQDHQGRIASHILQRPKPANGPWKELDQATVRKYIQAQVISKLDIVTIPERSPEASVSSLTDDIGIYIDYIKTQGKIPRVSIDMEGDDELFIEKIEETRSAGIANFAIRHRSMTQNYAKFVSLKGLGKSTWMHMTGIERASRKRVNDEILPVSYPSLLTLFEIKSTSLRTYAPPLDAEMEYSALRLFDEASLGLLNREEQRSMYPTDEFVSDCGFAPFNDIRTRSDIYSLCAERELHEPIYGYESVASRYSLRQSASSLRKGTFVDDYASQHAYLDRAVQDVLVKARI